MPEANPIFKETAFAHRFKDLKGRQCATACHNHNSSQRNEREDPRSTHFCRFPDDTNERHVRFNRNISTGSIDTGVRTHRDFELAKQNRINPNGYALTYDMNNRRNPNLKSPTAVRWRPDPTLLSLLTGGLCRCNSNKQNYRYTFTSIAAMHAFAGKKQSQRGFRIAAQNQDACQGDPEIDCNRFRPFVILGDPLSEDQHAQADHHKNNAQLDPEH